ncbi:MAG: tetratricopeptide repeat protein [Oligoflexus sp.]|nr:tetratricopeptide repeat protein [Oligoflexus sp.]
MFEQQTRPAPEVVKSIAIDDPHSNPELDRLIQEQSKKSVDESTKVDLSFDANPLVHKALVYIGNDQWKDAEPLLLKALDEDPDNLTVLSSLVTVYDVGFGNAAKAISYMEKILSLDPESRGALVRYRFLSSSYRKQSHAIKFLADYSTADHFLIPLTIAQLYQDQRQYDKALPFFSRLVVFCLRPSIQ